MLTVRRVVSKQLKAALPSVRYVTSNAYNQLGGAAFLKFSEEVRDALATRKPVVALESTILTHGLPFPTNVEMAIQVENLIRREGAVPATTAFVDGAARVGLNQLELAEFADRKDAVKISRRDIPYVLAHKLTGGTTISATMILAHLAKIQVFATGGLGGVHRGVADHWDISADLEELGRTPVAVVCSGPKSILDIPKTIEYLETKGCHVSTYSPAGTAANIPGFFTPDSGVPSPFVFASPNDAAQTIFEGTRFGLDSGYVFCVPASEEHALDKAVVDKAINFALLEAAQQGITGKATTPFLLKKVWEATGGDSVKTNVEFVKNNALMAARIACRIAALRENSNSSNSSSNNGSGASAILGDLGASATSLGGGIGSGISAASSAAKRASLNEQHQQSQLSLDQQQLREDQIAMRQVNMAQPIDLVEEFAGETEPALEATRSIHMPVQLKPKASSSRVLGPSLFDQAEVAVIGALSQDITCTLDIDAQNISVSSYPGRITTSLGGTAHNVALASAYAGAATRLISCVGDREEAEIAKSVSPALDVSGVKVSDKDRTARYVCSNDKKGDLIVACADMDAVQNLSTKHIQRQIANSRPNICVFDGNLGLEQQDMILKSRSRDYDPLIVFEPTSVPKAARFAHNKDLKLFPNASLDIATPNYLELMSMFEEFSFRERFDIHHWFPIIDQLPLNDPFTRMKLDIFARSHPSLEKISESGLVLACNQLLPFIPNLFVTNGSNGVISFQLIENLKDRTGGVKDGPNSVYILSKNKAYGILIQHFPVTVEVSDEDAKSVNGIGDTFCGALVAQLAKSREWLRDDGPLKKEHVHRAMHAASLSLQTYQAVNSEITSLFNDND